MNIGVVGTGYVGLVVGACLAENGNTVVCVDADRGKVDALRGGEIPIYEPGLNEMVPRNVAAERLSFTTDLEGSVRAADVLFIAVGTPQDEDGSADLSHVLEVARGIGRAMNGFKVVVNKSTVPVGTAAKVRQVIGSLTKHPFAVVSNPEFLKEGTAVDDFLKPDRVVIGIDDPKVETIMRTPYQPLVRTGNPILVKALIRMGEEAGLELSLVGAVDRTNEQQKRIVVPRIAAHLGGLPGKRVAIWGLAFKPKTDDMREAPAAAIIEGLLEGGAAVTAYDPEAGRVAGRHFGDRITICDRSYDAVEGADALAVVTEWNEFREPDFKKIKSLMRRPAIFDGRNIYNPRSLREMGFYYEGIGQR